MLCSRIRRTISNVTPVYNDPSAQARTYTYHIIRLIVSLPFLTSFLRGTFILFSMDSFIYPGLRILVAIIIAFVLDQLQRRFIKLPGHITSPRATTYIYAIHSLISVALFFSVGYFILAELNINITPFFASAGIIGIIVGLGFRPLLEDFFTAAFLFTDDTVRIGDYVVIGTSEGWIENIGLRTIRIRDRSGALHIFPNREVKKVINFSRRNVEVIIDFPVKHKGRIDDILPVFGIALDQLYNQKDLGKFVTHDSRISGIDEVKENGTLIIRIILQARIMHRGAISRRYRYLVLKELEKKKLANW